MVPTDLPTTPSASAPRGDSTSEADGDDRVPRTRLGLDAGLKDSRRSTARDGVPGARPPVFARVLPSANRRRGRDAPPARRPACSPSSSEEPSSNIGTAPSSMDPRERWVGAGGKGLLVARAPPVNASPRADAAVRHRHPELADLTLVQQPGPTTDGTRPVTRVAAAAASTAARVSPSLACVMMCLPTSASPHSSRISARSSSATKCDDRAPPPTMARGTRSDGRVGSGGRARRLLLGGRRRPRVVVVDPREVSPSRDAACTAIRARGSCRATGGRVARGCARTRRGRAGICASRN